ncbi:ABC transporter permease [Sediminispirochaeta smaragdinae]|uniref:Binding-protein-dependent transport systems inner membrane component n=1 Tax=Sediminispirochaeta smaragdinae (strain DSM 11293 / JCM 15392 / SEBR 4228) TaxID=573413 RepID=E1R707_SEDSS|nr:ABC transporter permease [Sediminispirochaeta smaragdinae]ADK81334.1 binding-protein-dependent transport systems inner membrane component [Sediminispirochaeta smaragdinae DSM 11293]
MRRILGLLMVLLIVGVLVFTIVRLIPGDPASVMLGPEATPESIEELRTTMGLDKPFLIQMLNWFAKAIHGDFGNSYFYDMSVTKLIISRMEPTLLLMSMGLLVSILLGIPMGILSAINHNTFLDRLFILLAMVGISVPNFWLGLMLILVFAQNLHIFPVLGYKLISESGFWTSIYYLILPAFALGLQLASETARLTRSSMLEVLRSDYIRTAKSKGVSKFLLVMKHAFKNAMIPTVTGIGLNVARLAGGAVVTEAVFNIPGAGNLIVTAISRRDYSLIQGHIMYVALMFVLVNLIIDILYKLLDPRVTYS